MMSLLVHVNDWVIVIWRKVSNVLALSRREQATFNEMMMMSDLY
jgi:hypothetical protein